MRKWLQGPAHGQGLARKIWKEHNRSVIKKKKDILMDEEIPLEAWQVIWSQAAKSSLCTLYKENTNKILDFWYLIPNVLHTSYPTSFDYCWCCHRDRGTLFHIYWSCPLFGT